VHVFVVQDKTGRSIRLTRTQWSHICERAEMAGQIERIRETIERPMARLPSPSDTQVAYFVKRYADSPTKGNFLVVAVKYLNGDGFVITAFYSSKPHL
jgi:hypothetical protein